MTGSLHIVGIGPGAEDLITPAAMQALEQSDDLVGYAPYLARLKPRPEQTLYASDNRVEIDRAQHALSLAASGRKVAVVSSGDPGIFAMAAAVFEAFEQGPDLWKNLDVQVLPGISAMLAAAARVGAPLGHDFCVINLSDNLKPQDIIAQRLRLCIQGDFAIALYNPRSLARPEGFARALDLLREETANLAPARPVIFARAVSTPQETITVQPLDQADPTLADMRTLVLIGSSRTRVLPPLGSRTHPLIYTPRSA